MSPSGISMSLACYLVLAHIWYWEPRKNPHYLKQAAISAIGNWTFYKQWIPQYLQRFGYFYL